mmetsp:Transcript_20108/g.80207  ORF Transcript_20108/g.80207 Transcript_20108/m.80207 type:complete len:257 (-) Transcript_20108:446-1216(-)
MTSTTRRSGTQSRTARVVVLLARRRPPEPPQRFGLGLRDVAPFDEVHRRDEIDDRLDRRELIVRVVRLQDDEEDRRAEPARRQQQEAPVAHDPIRAAMFQRGVVVQESERDDDVVQRGPLLRVFREVVGIRRDNEESRSDAKGERPGEDAPKVKPVVVVHDVAHRRDHHGHAREQEQPRRDEEVRREVPRSALLHRTRLAAASRQAKAALPWCSAPPSMTTRGGVRRPVVVLVVLLGGRRRVVSRRRGAGGGGVAS